MQETLFSNRELDLLDLFTKGSKSKLEYDAYMIYYYANIIAEIEIEYDRCSIR